MVALIAVGGVIAAAAVAGALVALAPSGGTTPTEALGSPHFADESLSAGLEHINGWGYSASIGGGLATFDCDDDGRPDLYLSGGDNPAALFRNESAPGASLAFTPVADANVSLSNVMGAYPVDIDGDGHIDLAVLRVGGLELLRGMGDCRFEPANGAWSLRSPATWATAFSATWEGKSTLPTLALGSYVNLDPSGEATYTCPDNELYRPNASGTGYSLPIPLTPGYCPLSMLFSDWDGSGRRDLRVSNDRHYYDNLEGQEQLWRIADGEPPYLYQASDGWALVQIWGMGIASQDLTDDGLPEIYLTSQGDNKLQTLLAGSEQPTYRDIALKSGVVATRPVVGGDGLPSTAWHPAFEDVNNDGYVDLYVSKGNIDRVPGYAIRDPSNLFLGQPDGVFVERAATAGVVSYERTRGASLVDLNQDGLLDLVEMKVNAPVRVWRNVGAGDEAASVPMGHWLEVRPTQAGPNRDAIGAVLEVQVGESVTRRELTIGGGHISGQLGWQHFGLGPSDSARVRVTWPDGEVGSWMSVDADQRVVVERGVSEPQPWQPPAG